ncbi:hypothetical protein BDB01DRAFT_857127 [Pilobolus umbonatus]|nr:hypothetical protein BDB01DRAFT_857127 [Pilobolus umbonatus]
MRPIRLSLVRLSRLARATLVLGLNLLFLGNNCTSGLDNFVGVQDTVKLNLEPLWPHVPVRLNKRKFKPRIPTNKRAKPRPNPPTN